ncbi:CRISPR-associated endonuclease Cas6 [Desulfobacula toluolica]|uniref:Conserved uncharacterized protein n=1 Tax=Desulfobacula toluolica (strain DSM 7467 / Tol2) TaxID=651182 RepID=K0NQD9_DESTT|nr:CRISPR-associated endonuclease Cas6 [Desulfobacula toluolica]CCK81112.1 conserved uncharacterized protein [Desulfobacula toluolica Tol2]
MKKAILYFNNIKLNSSQIHKLRGYVGNVFAEHDLIHNHDSVTGKSIYRYPLIQFKIIDHDPCIIALTEKAVQVFTEIFMTLDEIVIDGKVIPIFEKDLKVESVEFGFSSETFMYEFVSPWASLNQKNFKIFITLKTETEKTELLKRILIGNILSMSKYLGVHLEKEQQIQTNLQLKPAKVILKGKQMMGFKGLFKTNFRIPDHLGLGKSVSRGFGTIRRLI